MHAEESEGLCRMVCFYTHACVCNWKCGCMQERVWGCAGGSGGTCMCVQLEVWVHAGEHMHVCAIGSGCMQERVWGYADESVGTCMCVQLEVWMHSGESLELVMQEGVLAHACVCN